jgi:hypothetical protein
VGPSLADILAEAGALSAAAAGGAPQSVAAAAAAPVAVASPGEGAGPAVAASAGGPDNPLLAAALAAVAGLQAQAVGAATARRRAKAPEALSAFVASVPGLEACSPVQQACAYLAHRFQTAGRKRHADTGHRYMAASSLDSELAALRAASYSQYGRLAWNPRTGDGNPFHSAEVDALVAGAKARLCALGIKPEPAPEAYLSEVVTILRDVDAAVAALPAGHPKRVTLLQLRFAFLCCTLWGDRVKDVVERDFEDVVVVATAAEAAQESARLRAGRYVDHDGQPVEVPPSGGWAVVRYKLDKGAKLSKDPVLVNRAQVYPLLDVDSGTCPALALAELAVEYRTCLAAEPRLTDAQRALGHVGPVVKAFLFNSPSRPGSLDRVKPDTLDKRLNTYLDKVHGGKMAHLTGHSFRRGSSQLLRQAGGDESRILEHFRWRQARTALGYLAPTRVDDVDPVQCTQPGGTQMVADLQAALARTAAPLPAAVSAFASAQRGPDRVSSAVRGGARPVPARPSAAASQLP